MCVCCVFVRNIYSVRWQQWWKTSLVNDVFQIHAVLVSVYTLGVKCGNCDDPTGNQNQFCYFNDSFQLVTYMRCYWCCENNCVASSASVEVVWLQSWQTSLHLRIGLLPFFSIHTCEYTLSIYIVLQVQQGTLRTFVVRISFVIRHHP